MDHKRVNSERRPPVWQLSVAFALVYVGYGLNFLAVKLGVHDLPSFLFASSYVLPAGVLLLLGRVLTRRPAGISFQGLYRAGGAAVFLFVGGVGLVAEGEKLGVPSGMAAIIKSSVPLWVVVIQMVRPGGERPGKLTGIGLAVGAVGVGLLLLPEVLHPNSAPAEPAGALALVLSALLFAVGSVMVRHYPPTASPTTSSAWMMVFGGAYLFILGAALGQLREIPREIPDQVWGAYAFLLLGHSVLAFSAMVWLLSHISATLVTTKFYVSPIIAVFAGWWVLHERVGLNTWLSLALIFAGVGLAMTGEAREQRELGLRPDDADELQE